MAANAELAMATVPGDTLRCTWDDKRRAFACPVAACTFHGDKDHLSLHLAMDHQNEASLRGVKVAYYRDSVLVGWVIMC